MSNISINSLSDLKSIVRAGDAVWIYGATRLGIILRNALKKTGVITAAFLEISKCDIESGATVAGVEVKPVADTAPSERHRLVIISSTDYMSRYLMLAGLGFTNIATLTANAQRDLEKHTPVYMDFMCPGFAKCGTTTLQEVLKLNKSAYLPPAKETFFLQWFENGRDATSVLRSRHFSGVKPYQKIGCIEPSHYNRAKSAHEYFGDELKLVFMLRNPAEAEFSYFKMVARYLYKPKNLAYFRRHKRYGSEMFIDHVRTDVLTGAGKRFNYDRWLDEYLKYYPRENIKIVLFEELLKAPTDTLNDIQAFIGVKPMAFDKLPRANEGKKVARNYLCAKINLRMFDEDERRKARKVDARALIYRKFVKPIVFFFTLKNSDEKLKPDARALLMDYYAPSIKRLEEIMGRSLKGIWY